MDSTTHIISTKQKSKLFSSSQFECIKKKKTKKHKKKTMGHERKYMLVKILKVTNNCLLKRNRNAIKKKLKEF